MYLSDHPYAAHIDALLRTPYEQGKVRRDVLFEVLLSITCQCEDIRTYTHQSCLERVDQAMNILEVSES